MDAEQPEVVAEAKPLSKNAQKRLAKLGDAAERREEQLRRRKAYKERRKERKRNGEMEGPLRKKIRAVPMAESTSRQRIVIDCDFEDYMNEKDKRRVVQQLSYVYASNRRAAAPAQLHFVGMTGKLKEVYGQGSAERLNWDIRVDDRPYDEVFDRASVVYLTSESDNVLDELDDKDVYVIGGLVDHNAHKGLCHRNAVGKGVRHARLPIDKHVHVSTRHVLTINQVFDIMLNCVASGDWQEALLKAIPARKLP